MRSVNILCSFQIQVDLAVDTNKGYDESNVLALPSKKRDTAQKHEPQQKVRKLTKKERKKLEKVIELKDKKAKVILFIKALFVLYNLIKKHTELIKCICCDVFKALLTLFGCI